MRYLGQIESDDRVDPGNTDKVDRLQDGITAYLPKSELSHSQGQ